MRDALVVLTLLVTTAACGGSNPGAPTPDVPAPAPQPSPAASPQAVVLRSAALRGANGHSASGTARIVREGGSHRLELGSDFRIDSGNNDVYLTREPGNPRDGDLNLGEMRQTTGEQRYAMPDDGARYAHVVLWCRPFRVPIGLGELK